MTRAERRLPKTYDAPISTTRPSIWGVLDDVRLRVDRVSISLLRVSVGVVFIWFGALKLTGSSP